MVLEKKIETEDKKTTPWNLVASGHKKRVQGRGNYMVCAV